MKFLALTQIGGGQIFRQRGENGIFSPQPSIIFSFLPKSDTRCIVLSLRSSSSSLLMSEAMEKLEDLFGGDEEPADTVGRDIIVERLGETMADGGKGGGGEADLLFAAAATAAASAAPKAFVEAVVVRSPAGGGGGGGLRSTTATEAAAVTVMKNLSQ